MPAPAVTVVVRTKDRPQFLRRALQNIAQQSFTDLEVVVVNDGGAPEPVEDAVRRAWTGARGVVILHHPTPLGMEAASNAGIQATDSTYIAVHDDDDLWEPEFLERTVAELERTGAMLVTTRVDRYYERETEDGFEHLHSEPHWGELHEVTIQDLWRTNRTVPIAILYRRELHQSIGLYDPDLPVVGDWEFNLRAAAHHPVAMLDEPLAHWSHRPESRGDAGNSVYEKQRDHQIQDARVRAAAIRRDLAAHGNEGSYLYQAHLSGLSEMRDEHTQNLLHEVLGRLEDLERRLERIDAQTARGPARGLLAEMRRAAAKTGRALRRRRGQGAGPGTGQGAGPDRATTPEDRR